jgi:hypothetical protein
VRLADVLPRHAAAVALRATRALALTSAEELAGGALVDALRRANEEMLAALDADETEQCPPDELAGAYTQFIEEWCRKEDVEAHLVRTDIQIVISSLLHTWLIKKLQFFFGALDGTLFRVTVTEIVLGRQPACSDQTPNQEEYTVRSPPRGTCPLTHYARAPGTISTSDAITYTEHRKTIHVYDTHGYTCLASAFTGRVGAWHSRLGGGGVDQRAMRSPDMRRDMALGGGSVFAVFLVRIVGEIRRTAGGEHTRRGAAGCTPITPFAHRRVDREEE